MKKKITQNRNIKNAFKNEVNNLLKIKDVREFRVALTKKIKSPLFQSSLFFSKNKFLQSGFGGSYSRTFLEENHEHLLLMLLIKLNREVSILNKYIYHKNKYESDILNGSYVSALESIEQVRDCVGLSFWYLEAKLSTLSLLGRNEEFIGFYKSVLELNINEIEARDLELIFDRTSPSTKNDRITYTLDSLKDGLSVGDALDSYIIDFMHRFNCGEKYNSAKVMSYYWQCNIIDIFNSTCKLLFTGSICVENLDAETQRDIIALAEKIDDVRLKNFVGISVPQVIELGGKYVDVCDLYILGEFEKCKLYYEREFLSRKSIFSLYEFYINSIIDTDVKLLSSGLGNGVFRKIIEYSLSYSDKSCDCLKKLYYVLNHIDALQAYSLRDAKRIVSFDRDKVESIYRYFECSSFPINPFNKEQVFEDSISSKMTRSKSEYLIDHPLPDYRNKKRVADYHFHAKSFSDAIEFYLGISDAPLHMKDEINNKIILCYFYNNNVLCACEFICNLYFNNELNVGRVDCKQVLEVLEDCDPPEETVVEIPIAVYLLANQVNEEQVISLYLDDYLEYVNANKPSDLEPIDDKHVFLMHKVCNLNVLESLHTVRDIYVSSSDRLLDRMLILSKLNDESNDEIIKETKFLTTQYSRNLCVKDIGRGKININFDVLSEIIKKEKSHYIEGMIKAYEDGHCSFEFTYEEIKNQKNTDIYTSVYEFLCSVRDVYALDGKYGLDYQLNTKIRHNGIVPAIRSIFDSEGILCKTSDGSYRDNELFERECKQLLKDIPYNDYQNKIKKLSMTIDIRLLKLKNVYMQIVTNDKADEERLFQFPITEHDIAGYILYFNSVSSGICDDYVKHALELLKKKTVSCLKLGQALLEMGLYEAFLDDLKELKSALKPISDNKYKSSLSLVMNDLKIKMAEFSEWLGFSEVVGENFKIDVAIYEAENFVKSILPNVSLKVSLDDRVNLLFNGKLLDSFVNMFILLFENAAKKRKHSERSEIEVVVISNDCDSINISIVNECSGVDGEVIDKINAEINTQEFLNKANKEKNSGLFKVKKILEIDFQSENKIQLSCEYDRFIFSADVGVTNLIA